MVEAPRTIEHRLDAMGRAAGGSPDGAAFAAGHAGGTPPPAPEFLRAVAARRLAGVAKVAMGVAGGAGVVVVLVLLVLRAPRAPVPETPQLPSRAEPEPTFWNLRAGVEDPSGLDSLMRTDGGLGAGSGEGPAALPPAGVAPSSWPEDLRPR